MYQAVFESRKRYKDPFNELELDVVFSKEGKSWRVPTFWRGNSEWGVRFTPASPGKYEYRLVSSDPSNLELNSLDGYVDISTCSVENELLKRGPFRVSQSGRYFEHADGTPFYWLGDSWYSGLSDRMNWKSFCEMTHDRKKKGFTVIQLAVMSPSNEETAPIDAGFRNEGGPVWDREFRSINPRYFDYADRRVQHLVEAGLVPALIGAWRQVLAQIGVVKMKKYWRYIIARYGAYPVFWIAGGEVYDPPLDQRKAGLFYGSTQWDPMCSGWTEVVRYIRETDPYHHPLSVHEIDPPYDTPLQDESLKDFELFQAGHRGWPSIATEVAQLNLHYARTEVRKPLVVGEVGYEGLANDHHAPFQRIAFWLAMLNGAAGFTYGNAMTALCYSEYKPFHRTKYSAMTWRDGMQLPGASQVGIGAQLLRRYQWERMEPHPEWVTPGGTTLLQPQQKVSGFDIDLVAALSTGSPPPDDELPLGEWRNHRGCFRLPYSAGIPRQLRIVFIPSIRFGASPCVPTILRLEQDIRYRAYYWEPALGIRFDLGWVQRPSPGEIICKDALKDRQLEWTRHSIANGSRLSVLASTYERDVVLSVAARSDLDIGLVFRFSDPDNYLAALYSCEEEALYFVERIKGRQGKPMGRVPATQLGVSVRLYAEARGRTAVLAISDDRHTVTTPIIDLSQSMSGHVGFICEDDQSAQFLGNFEVRRSPSLVEDDKLEKVLYDAYGMFRGTITGPGWDDFGKVKHLLLDAYRPERLPFYGQDWVLVLEELGRGGTTRCVGS